MKILNKIILWYIKLMEKDKIINLNNKIKKSGKIVLKRNGRRVSFEGEKIAIAVRKAFEAKNKVEKKYKSEDINKVYIATLENILRMEKETVKVEEIQDIIEENLSILKYGEVRTAFSEYREKRAVSRKMFNDQRRDHKFSSIYSSSINKEIFEKNPNILMEKLPIKIFEQFGKKISEKFALSYILKRKIVDAVDTGEIFIHDIEYIPMGTTSSVMLNLEKIMESGFSTGIGKYRRPKNVLSYSVLTYTLIEALKKEQSGASGIPFFDKYFAQIFVENFKKEFLEYINIFLEFTDFKKFVALNSITTIVNRIESIDIDLNEFKPYIRGSEKVMEIIQLAYIKGLLKAEKRLRKGIEALVHNLNHNASRDKNKRKNIALNIGSDQTIEGLIVSKTLLDVMKKGIGENIAPIEPDIFIIISDDHLEKLDKRINERREKSNLENIQFISEDELNIKENLELKSEYIKEKLNDLNYLDILIYAMEISKERDNISFVFCGDNEKKINEGYCSKYLMEDMIIPENTVDPKKNNPEGRGILSTTSINLPRIAIKSLNKKDFYEELLEKLKLIFLQLFDRFNIQCDLNPEYFSPLYNEPVWIDTDKLKDGDRLRKILKHGNMNIGIVGLYETANILIKKENKDFEDVLKVSEEILKFIQKHIDEFKDEKNINLNIYADSTPTEYFARLDKALYGNTLNVFKKDKYEKGTSYPLKNIKISRKDIQDIPKDLEEKLKYEGKMQTYTKGGNSTKLKVDKDISLEDYIKLLKIVNENNINLLKLIFR